MEYNNPFKQKIYKNIFYPLSLLINNRWQVARTGGLYRSLNRFMLLFLFLAFFYTTSQGAIRIASVSGNWSNPATWGGNPVPTLADDVTINTGIVVIVDIAAVCNSLTINGGNSAIGGITISGANSLTVTTSTTINAPSNNFQARYIEVDAGSFVSGTLSMTSGSNPNRDCYVRISTGTCTVNGNISMAGAGNRNYFLFNCSLQ